MLLKTLIFAAASAAFVNGELPSADFSLNVRVIGWEKPVRLFQISYKNSDGNRLAILDLAQQSEAELNIYEFGKDAAHFQISSKSGCTIRKPDAKALEKDLLFPVKLSGAGTFDNPNSIFRLSGAEKPGEIDPFQKTQWVDFTSSTTIDDLKCTIRELRIVADDDHHTLGIPLRVEATCGTKIIAYEIFNYLPEADEDSFKVPDGYYCVPESNNVRKLPEVALATPKTIHFTRRSDQDARVKGWIDSELGIRKEESLPGDSVVITDMNNDIEYTLDKNTGACTIVKLEKTKMSPASFLYGFEPPAKLQVLKMSMEMGSFVLATTLGGNAKHLANIYLRQWRDSLIPLRTITYYDQSVDNVRIEGFTDEVDWEEFDVSTCLSTKSSEVFRLFFSIENHKEFGSVLELQRQVLKLLKKWSGSKNNLRFTNIQVYKDGSLSCEIQPNGSPGAANEPSSLTMVSKIVETVKSGRAKFTRPDNKTSEVVLVTYETLGAPQATYRAESVFLISLIVSVFSILLGLVVAILIMRKVPPQHSLRRALRL